MRRSQFEHHDCDDDGNYAITEGLQSGFGHHGLTAFNLRQNKPESNHQHAANQCCSMSAVAVALLPNGVISLNVFRYWHSHREVSRPITNKSPPLRLCTPMNEVEAVVKSRF